MENSEQIDDSVTHQNVLNNASLGESTSEFNFTELNYYNMRKDKTLFIFNHENFELKTPYLWHMCGGVPLPTRYGTDQDKETLKSVFNYLQFNVIEYDNLSRDAIWSVVDNFVQRDHRNTSCVVVAFLTHGSSDGVLYAYDGPYNISQIMSKFDNSNLLQIPKVYLIEACRGAKTNDGQYVELDGGSARIKIPTHGDIVVLYSTIEGYVSHRQLDGSWMIQIFCEVLREYHGSLDILHIITIVNSRMTGQVTDSLVPAANNKKQISETRYTLTKLLKF